ncbi:MAG: hypothetical protein JW973_16200 [Bacteroidales bacterium]|nr:hypothetical protein [Bacteroidales bacterium]
MGQVGFYAPGSNFAIVDWSITNAKLHQVFPDVISKEYAIRGLNYILGCHPASSWPFIWYENEVVVDGCAGYIYLAAMVNNMLKESRK